MKSEHIYHGDPRHHATHISVLVAELEAENDRLRDVERQLANSNAAVVAWQLRATDAEADLRATRAVADDLAVALHHCSVYLPLFIEDGRRLDRALAVNEQVHVAMKAYCGLTQTRRQDLTNRTVTKEVHD